MGSSRHWDQLCSTEHLCSWRRAKKQGEALRAEALETKCFTQQGNNYHIHEFMHPQHITSSSNNSNNLNLFSLDTLLASVSLGKAQTVSAEQESLLMLVIECHFLDDSPSEKVVLFLYFCRDFYVPRNPQKGRSRCMENKCKITPFIRLQAVLNERSKQTVLITTATMFTNPAEGWKIVTIRQ